MFDNLFEEWLTPSQAAASLGLSARRVKQLAQHGRLVAVWTPYGRLIHRDSVEALQQQRAAAASERDRHLVTPSPESVGGERHQAASVSTSKGAHRE
jgi:excisionase family DNA binding protein